MSGCLVSFFFKVSHHRRVGAGLDAQRRRRPQAEVVGAVGGGQGGATGDDDGEQAARSAEV